MSSGTARPGRAAGISQERRSADRPLPLAALRAGSRRPRSGDGGQVEDAFGVAVQEQLGGLVVELEAGEAGQAVGGGPGGVVGAEKYLAAAVILQVLNQVAGVAAGLVGGGVDVDVGI